MEQADNLQTMQAIVVTDPKQGLEGMQLQEMPMPIADLNDVIVKVQAAGFTHDELSWPGTWADRNGKDRTPSIPGHELAGTVVALGYGTTGFSIGQRVAGLTDWTRNGTLAGYVAVEARNLSALPADVDYAEGAALVMPGLTAWQGLYTHGNLQAGQRVLVHGAAGVVGSMVVQLARLTGAYVIGTGRGNSRQTALDYGVHQYIDLEKEILDKLEPVDLVFDVFGGDITQQSATLIRKGGRLISIAGPTDAQPVNGMTIDFIVEAIPQQLDQVIRLFREGKLKNNIGKIVSLKEAPSHFNAKKLKGKTIISMME